MSERASDEVQQTSWLSRARLTAIRYGLVIAAAWLAFQILTQGISDHYLQTNPMLAVVWRADSPDALGALARQELAAHNSARAARLAMRALRAEPLNVDALSTLALAADQTGNKKEADALMELAVTHSRRDVLSQFWLFRKYIFEKKYPEAFDHVDALLRLVDGPVQENIFSAVVAAAYRPGAIGPLIARLRTDPPWRSDFLSFLCGDPRPPSEAEAYAVLVGLRKGAAPPADDEVAAYLARLIGERKYSEAWVAYRALAPSVPAGGEYVMDSDFWSGHAIAPFSWSIRDDVGWTAQVVAVPGEGDRQALRIEYDGYSPSPPLRQLLVLPAGTYRLSGLQRAATTGASSFFLWAVACVDAAAPLAHTMRQNIPVNRWTSFGVQIQVPTTGCPAQWLSLRTEPGDVQTDNIIWFTHLSVRRIFVSE